MRNSLAGLLCSVFLFSVAGPVAANSNHVNWTETWIGFEGEFFIDDFMFDTNSEYDLVDTDPVIVSQDFIGFGTSVIGAIVDIRIPNFFDPLPTKLVDITFVGQNSGASGSDLPFVRSIIGADAPFSGPPGPASTVFGEFVSTDGTSEVLNEHWIMHPNPDFETVSVFIPTGFEFSSMHVFTQSVPEPGTLAMFGSGMVGLLLAGRRRN